MSCCLTESESGNAFFRKYFPCVKTGDGPNEHIVTDYYLCKDNVDKVVDGIVTKMIVTTDRNIPKANFNKHIKPYCCSYLKELKNGKEVG